MRQRLSKTGWRERTAPLSLPPQTTTKTPPPSNKKERSPATAASTSLTTARRLRSRVGRRVPSALQRLRCQAHTLGRPFDPSLAESAADRGLRPRTLCLRGMTNYPTSGPSSTPPPPPPPPAHYLLVSPFRRYSIYRWDQVTAPSKISHLVSSATGKRGQRQLVNAMEMNEIATKRRRAPPAFENSRSAQRTKQIWMRGWKMYIS